jgi:hypothetical protein
MRPTMAGTITAPALTAASAALTGCAADAGAGPVPTIVDAVPHLTPTPPDEWPDDRFDVVRTLTRTADGRPFAQLPELVLPQDQSGVIER